MIITARRRAVMSEEKPEPGISNSLSASRFLEGNASGADWREPAHYNPLLSCDRHCWAGEWLRRNPAFLADLRAARCSTEERLVGKESLSSCRSWWCPYH